MIEQRYWHPPLPAKPDYSPTDCCWNMYHLTPFTRGWVLFSAGEMMIPAIALNIMSILVSLRHSYEAHWVTLGPISPDIWIKGADHALRVDRVQLYLFHFTAELGDFVLSMILDKGAMAWVNNIIVHCCSATVKSQGLLELQFFQCVEVITECSWWVWSFHYSIPFHRHHNMVQWCATNNIITVLELGYVHYIFSLITIII